MSVVKNSKGLSSRFRLHSQSSVASYVDGRCLAADLSTMNVWPARPGQNNFPFS